VEVIYSPKALKDLDYWKRSGNVKIQKKIQQLIFAIQKSPFEGIGKPEPLKYDLSGKWSRRINQEHRIIYAINDKNQISVLDILSLKGHY
jgi:toxin YoeB